MSAEAPFASSVELVLGAHAPLVDAQRASALAGAAMAPATKAARVLGKMRGAG